MMDVFKTSDLYQAAYLSHKTKAPLTFEMHDKRVIFTFKNDAPTLAALNSFNSDEPIGAFTFANIIKQTRTAMIRRKSE